VIGWGWILGVVFIPTNATERVSLLLHSAKSSSGIVGCTSNGAKGEVLEGTARIGVVHGEAWERA